MTYTSKDDITYVDLLETAHNTYNRGDFPIYILSNLMPCLENIALHIPPPLTSHSVYSLKPTKMSEFQNENQNRKKICTVSKKDANKLSQSIIANGKWQVNNTITYMKCFELHCIALRVDP